MLMLMYNQSYNTYSSLECLTTGKYKQHLYNNSKKKKKKKRKPCKWSTSALQWAHWWWAAKRSSESEQLIQDGHDVNAISALGIMPIMTASARGHDRVVLELIRAGASVVSSHEWSSVATGSTA